MNPTNGKLSKRQWFRMSFLECIAISMLMIPYISLKLAGQYHVVALFFGLALAVLYGMLLTLLATKYPDGYVNAIRNHMGGFAGVFDVVYAIRYVLRAAFIALFFAMVVQQYLMRSFSLYTIVISFLVLCGYGASKTMEGRGSMFELLFWWMLAPLILLVVFSISNLDIGMLQAEVSSHAGMRGIVKGGYGILLALSPFEFQIYSQTCVKDFSKNDAWKLFVWVAFSVLFAYLFIVGILGAGWTESDIAASFNVMEAAAFPGGTVSRLDYAVMAFWVIGVFAIVSGYLHYAGNYVFSLCSVKMKFGKTMTFLAVTTVSIVFVFVLQNGVVADYLMRYFLYADFAMSLLLPAIVAVVKVKEKRKIGKTLACLVFAAAVVCVIFIDENLGEQFVATKSGAIERQQESLEHRDYVTTMQVDTDTSDRYVFTFLIADLSGYEGESSLKESEYVVCADSLKSAMAVYQEQENRQLDLGHIEQIVTEETNDAWHRLLLEFGRQPGVSKSVSVVVGTQEEKYILREMIKAAYGRESF